VHGLLPLTREVIVRAWIAASDLQGAAPGEEPEPIARLGSTAISLSEAARVIPALLLAGYKVNCAPDVFDETAYQQAVHRLRARAPRPAPPRPAANGTGQLPLP